MEYLSCQSSPIGMGRIRKSVEIDRTRSPEILTRGQVRELVIELVENGLGMEI